jgi:ATP phosphoribosyltransferase
MNQRQDIRLSLPSKGRMAESARDFLADCGLKVKQSNPRQYAARIPALPQLTVLLQRPGDIVVSVRDGSVDFGITGMDLVAERRGDNGDVLVLHDALGFSRCRLCLAVPETWDDRSGWRPSSRISPAISWMRTTSRPSRSSRPRGRWRWRRPSATPT